MSACVCMCVFPIRVRYKLPFTQLTMVPLELALAFVLESLGSTGVGLLRELDAEEALDLLGVDISSTSLQNGGCW